MGRLGDLSPAASIAVGIVVGLLSTSVQSVGLTLQRKSHLLEDSKEDELARRPPYRRRKWQIGMFMFVMSNLVGSTIQITTLPLPVLSTLQASGLVFNTICATLILSERFTRWSFGGTVLVAGGAVLIALFGALPEPTHNLDQLLELLGRPQFIAWMFGTFILIALVLLGAFFLPRLARFNPQYLYQPLNHQHHSPHASPRVRLLTGMSYGFASAILSAHTLLLAKSAVELILTSLPFTRHSNSDANEFTHYQSYLILVALVAFALLQLYFLHRGLKLASTSVLYPFVFCVYNVVAILDGLIYFKQTDRLPPLHAGLITLGTVILLAGVLALSWRLDEQGLAQEREWGTEHPVTPTAQVSALAPGMGLVEDTLTESPSGTETNDLTDEEARRAPLMSESTPLLAHRAATVGFDALRRPESGYGTSRTRRSSRGSGSLLGVTPRRRGVTLWERERIWHELMDDKEVAFSPTARNLHDEVGRGHQRRKTVTGVRSGGLVEERDESADNTREADKAARKKGLRRAKTTPMREGMAHESESGSAAEENISGEAWKKRRRRARENGSGAGVVGSGRGLERRSVSTPVGHMTLTRGSQRGSRRDRTRVVDRVGGLFVSNH